MADVDDAIEFMRMSNEADENQRALALTDLKFRYGEQWPQYAIASRGLDRPQLTINEMDSYIRQVTNGQRQQRPRIKVHPVDDFADPKTAKVITGLMRHFEVNSDADNAYDIAFDFAATMGWGYWRIRNDYVREDSFDQDIFIDSVDNPFSVYFDPASRLPDGSDQEKCLITDLMKKTEFKKLYPGADAISFSEDNTGDNNPEWVNKYEIRIAEYFYVDRKPMKLVKLSDGNSVFEDEMPPQRLLDMHGVQIIGDRDSQKRIVKWRKQTSLDVLEEKVLPWRWIPVVPVYWTNTKIDNKILRQGMVRPGMDSQRMVNFWHTSITESIALAPKAKWLIAEGQDEGHEQEFKNANLSSTAVLRYKPTDVDGQPAPPPQRMQPEPPPSGSIEAAFLSNQNLQRVMGIFDPNMQEGKAKSGKAVNAERSQSENSNYHGYDNLTRSIKHTARIILSGIPKVLNESTTRRIIGEDGTPSMVKINQDPQQDETSQAIATVLNDVRVGTYDVVMDTGPGYDSKRLQGVDSMMQLLGTPMGEKVGAVGDDLIVRQMDFPGSDVLADRLAAANPLSQIDEKSDIPPQVQMKLKQADATIKQMQDAIQQLQTELKYKTGLEQMKQEGQTKRTLMVESNKAHDSQMWANEERNDTAVDNDTRLQIAEIQAHVALLLARIDERKEHGNMEGAAKERAEH
jgi:hypothetical protein